MRFSSFMSGLRYALVLLLPALPAVAQAPDSIAAPVQVSSSGTLIKLGTGLTRGFALGSFEGFSVPLVLSAEHYFSPTFSVYGNAFSGINVIRRTRYLNESRKGTFSQLGFDAGVRYYYNQEKRRQKGRAAGPFVGNYLALQSTSVYIPNDFSRTYRYSTLTAIWGLQRRLGKYGWLDAYAGMGIARFPNYTYNSFFSGPQRVSARYDLAPEIGIKLGLGSRLTR